MAVNKVEKSAFHLSVFTLSILKIYCWAKTLNDECFFNFIVCKKGSVNFLVQQINSKYISKALTLYQINAAQFHHKLRSNLHGSLLENGQFSFEGMIMVFYLY